MLITKSVLVKLNSSNINFYRKLNYIIPENPFNKTIIVFTKDLSKGSHVLVDIKCDYCDNKKTVTYKEYNRNIKFNGNFSCSNKCGSIKKKELSLLKYGVDSPSKLEKVKQKNKNTCLEKYGSEYYMSTEDFKLKSKSSNLEKYGVENVMLSDEIKTKLKSSNLEKYGVENTFQSELIKDKIKETNLEKYGKEYYSQIDEYKIKFKNTCLNKYGVDNPFKSDIIKNVIKKNNLMKYGVEYYMSSNEFKEKSKETNLEKYNAKYPTQSEIIRKLNNDNCKDLSYIKYIGYNVSLFNCDSGKSHTFEISSSNYHSRIKANLPLCTICNPIGDQKSIKEKELHEFIFNNYTGEIIQSYRDISEIDIYLPELNIGFEFNGLYWHSEQYKDRNYHLDKTNYFKEKGIRIIHIWEDDWTLKQDIIKSQIRNLLGINSEKIFARKCLVRELKSVTEFLNKNHIQGVDKSNIKLGLFYNAELVSVMTFNKLEGRKKLEQGEWNLSRFCNKLNTNVVGGASKLLKYFENKYDVKRIISYADKDWSVGQLYYTLGFKNINETKPDYKYIIDGKRRHKQNFKKANLKTKLTESKYMIDKEIYKIYDCGKLKFEK